MSEIHRMKEDRLQEFFSEMVNWGFVKRVEITKTCDGVIWAKLIHYRSGRYMQHGLKCGFKSGSGLNPIIDADQYQRDQLTTRLSLRSEK